MRALFIGTLATTLIGCTSFVAPQATTGGCTDCADRVESEQMVFKAAAVKKGSSTVTLDTEKFSGARHRNIAFSTEKRRDEGTETTKRSPPKVVHAADPVIENAKATIASMMEKSASVKFWEMRRATRFVLGEAIHYICGFVGWKNILGEDTGKFPFLYIVEHDEAYIVDENSDTATAIAHRNFCN